MRAKEFLTELWTQPYALTSRATGPANMEYGFKTKDDRPGRIVFDSFLDTDQGGTHVVLVIVHFYIAGEFETTGSGDAIAIFSTVVSACRDYLRRYRPPVVAFETDDDKKRNLYVKMSKMFPDYVIYPNWVEDPVVGDEIRDTLMYGIDEDAVVLHRRDYDPEKTRVYVEDEMHENAEDLDSLREACENWMEMYFDANDINTILTHPYSQQFKQPPAGIDRLYRGLVVSGGKVKAVPGKSNRKFVAYATHPYGAEAFLASLDISGRKVIIEKQFNPADFVLDFTGLYESLFPQHGIHNRYETEYEVWMRATKYYQTATEKEIVSDTAWGQTDDGEPGRGNLSESTFTGHEQQLRHFVKWCKEKLKITKPLPKMIFADRKESDDQHRTGYYDDDTNTMWVYTGNRNLIDIMRTVCHELVHRKQHEHKRAKPGESYPFAPIEQEADAVAGGLIKLYVREFPASIE